MSALSHWFKRRFPKPYAIYTDYVNLCGSSTGSNVTLRARARQLKSTSYAPWKTYTFICIWSAGLRENGF